MISNAFPKFLTRFYASPTFTLSASTARQAIPVLSIPHAPAKAKSSPARLPADWRQSSSAKFPEFYRPIAFASYFGRSRFTAGVQERISATTFASERQSNEFERFFRNIDLIEKFDSHLAEKIARTASLLTEKALRGLIALVSEEVVPKNSGKLFSDRFLPFLEILLDSSLAVRWLESYSAMREAKLENRFYLHDWLEEFFRQGETPASALFEEFLLLGKLIAEVRGEDLPRIFKTEISRRPILVDRSRNVFIQIESQPQRADDAGAMERFLQEASEDRRKAEKIGVTNFEYHFLGPDFPEAWASCLARDFNDSTLTGTQLFTQTHLKIFWRRSWDKEPVLRITQQGPKPVSPEVEALRRLPESPRFLAALRRGTEAWALKEQELVESWRAWIEQVAAKRPDGLSILTWLSKTPLSSSPQSAPLLECLLPRNKELTALFSLPPAPARALRDILAWEDAKALRAFFLVFCQTTHSAFLEQTLEDYAALQDLGVGNVQGSLQTALLDSLKDWQKKSRHWQGNLRGWLFSAQLVQKLARGLNPWKRATIEANLGPVPWQDNSPDKVVNLVADLLLECESYDLTVEYKSALNLADKSVRQARRYAASLRNRTAETGRLQVMRYYSRYESQEASLKLLDQIFEGLPLEISLVDGEGNEIKMQR